MNCPEFEELLQRRLDGEPASSPVADAHLAACAECRERHAAALLLLEGLRTLPRPQAPAGLSEHIVAAVRDDRRRLVRQRLRIGVGLALAASVLLTAFGLGWFDSLFRREAPPVAIGPEKQEPADASLTRSLTEVRLALAGVAERVADGADQPAKVLQVAAAPLEMVSLDTLPRVGPVTQTFETTGRSLQHTGTGTAAASRAMSGLTRRAMNYFAHNGPGTPAN